MTESSKSLKIIEKSVAKEPVKILTSLIKAKEREESLTSITTSTEIAATPITAIVATEAETAEKLLESQFATRDLKDLKEELAIRGLKESRKEELATSQTTITDQITIEEAQEAITDTVTIETVLMSAILAEVKAALTAESTDPEAMMTNQKAEEAADNLI